MGRCIHSKQFLPLGVLLTVTLLSGAVLSSSISHADVEEQADATITVSSACTMFRESTIPHVASGITSTYHEDVGTTRLKTICNDKDGYAIYAIGYSNDTDGDTNMYGEEYGEIIPTGTASGDVSNWSMKIGKDANSYNAANLTITPSFTSYTNIPSTQTKIASFEGATDTIEGSVVTTTYAIRVSSSQLADTYEGKVKYTMVHPADGTAPDEPEPIYAQDITAETCPTTPTTMVDSRDGEKYIIRKLPDGNCWMLENLRLDPATLKTTLTSENTNLAPGTTYTLPDATTSGFSYDSAGTPRLFTAAKNGTIFNGWDGSSKMGVYYNICVASAGTACDGTDAEYDICPAGWRLPTGGYGEDSEHYALYQAYGLLEPFVAAVRPTRTGQFHNSGLQNTGSYGYFWSSTSAGSGETYALITDSQASFYGKDNHYGLSVRCIAASSAPAKTYIQDVTPDTCPTTPTTVYDKRDEEVYTIQKLADGNCWLLDNLHLDIAGLSLDDLEGETNASSATLNYLKNGGGTSSDWYAKAPAQTWYNSIANSTTTPLVGKTGKNTTGSGGYEAGKYGYHYNYCAATAGTYCTSGAYSDPTISAVEDICPAGWRLPTGGNGGEYQTLYVNYNDYSDFVNALHVPLSGSYYQGEVWSGGTRGNFWSSTPNNYGNIYYLYVYDSGIDPLDGNNLSSGNSVRCVAKSTEPDPTRIYIQDVDKSTCPTTPTTVYDIRDNEAYTIQKLADGNCWLLDNLRLDPVSTSLSSLKGNTNASDTTLEYLKGISTGTSSDRYAESGVMEYDGTKVEPEIYNGPTVYTGDKNSLSVYGYGENRVGVLYNYCAASAGGYCYDSYSGENDATEDICPAGWRLPTGGEGGEYEVLYQAYESDLNNFRDALRTVPSGFISDDHSLSNNGSRTTGAVGFWTSTYDDIATMKTLYTTIPYLISPRSQYARNYSFSIRCIAKESEKTYIQDITLESCPTTPATVYDRRDNEEYTIQKLADGNCWLLDNLRLDASSLIRTLDTSNTNMSPNVAFTLPASTGGEFGSRTEPQVNADYKDTLVNYSNGQGKAGVYYNYCAATAGTICADNSPEDARYDICPAGWHMPSAEDRGNYRALFDAYGGELASTTSALRAVYAGYYRNNAANGQNSWGYYWSTSASSSSAIAILGLNSTNAFWSGYYDRLGGGLSVRCVKEPLIQDITPETCPTIPTTVYDIRDNSTYTIQKLADGNCWMLENLHLDSSSLTNALTTDNTNMSPSVPFTLPASSRDTSLSEAKVNADSKSTKRDSYEGVSRVGVYYNYCAATAGTVCGDSGERPSYDICPKGWRLPTGNDQEYAALYSAYDSNPDSLNKAFRTVYSGYFSSTGENFQSDQAKLWTATPSDTPGLTYAAAIAEDVISLSTSDSHDIEYSIRCIAYNDTPTTEPLHDIQDITPATCPTEPTTVYDTRDGQAYTIQKLADGKCWMLDNLNLGRSTVKVLTPDDTNIRSNFTLPGGVSTGFDEFTTPQINIDSRSDTTSYGDGENKIGVYYNFCAATAGTYCQPQNQSSGTPTEDICPKGWRLPTGGENGEYQNLYNQYSTYADFKNALHASLSGYFKYSSTNHQGSYGSFWSSTPVGDDRMYSLDVRATSVPNDFTSYRTAGISIRCVAYEPTETYIQDITPETCPTTPTTVYDTRDNSAYTIQKLADGNCWMLDNLRIGRSTVKVLTPDDTNITSNFTLPGSISTGFDEFTIPQINTDSKNKVTSYGAGDNKIGTYYNYCAATAGTYCYAEGEAEGSPTEDICPKGWRLPTGGEDGEYQSLYSQYSTYADFKNALHASLSGYFKYSSKNHQGSYGSYWSSTPVGDDRMYSLDVRLDSVPDDFTSYRTAGISIRCVAKQPPITYIQDVTAATCPTTPTVVYDKRDGEEYTIQKLADGKCWMLEHLRLDPATLIEPLTSANTNIASGRTYTLPSSVSSGFNNYSAAQINTGSKDTLVDYGTGIGQSKAGVYYNYCAATAGTVCSSSATPTQDICPAGWRLPTGNGGEYQTLYSAYNSDPQAFGNAFRMAYSGVFWGSNRVDFGVKGRSWSATPRFAGNSYDLCHEIKNGGYVTSTADTNGQDIGMGVRCVAK